MEIAYSRDQESSSKNQKNGQSSNYKKSSKFIPPTHPAYIVTSNFQGAHISQLQQEFDKNYIAMSMQTGKKKLSKIPDMPTDKYFIVVDDSAQPIVLQGQFLTLNKKVVNYPRGNNAQQVVEQFSKYIGLGHMEVNEESGKNSYNMEQNRYAREMEQYRKRFQGDDKLKLGGQRPGMNQNYCSSTTTRQVQSIGANGLKTVTKHVESSQTNNGKTVVSREVSGNYDKSGQTNMSNGRQFDRNGTSSISGLATGDNFRRQTGGLNMQQSTSNNFSSKSKSKLTLKQIVTRNEDLKVSQGCIYIYQNSKDSEQYKKLVQEIKRKYGESTIINVVYSIDQYNYACKKNKSSSNIIFMTQSSYMRLTKFFNKYHSLAVFTDGSQKMQYKKYQNVALFTNDSQRIFRFIEQFGKKREELRNKKSLRDLNHSDKQRDPSKKQSQQLNIPLMNQGSSNSFDKEQKSVNQRQVPQKYQEEIPQNYENDKMKSINELEKCKSKKKMQRGISLEVPQQYSRKTLSQLSGQDSIRNDKNNVNIPSNLMVGNSNNPAQNYDVRNYSPSPNLQLRNGEDASKINPSFIGFDNALENYRRRGSPNHKSKIKLMKVTDIDEEALKTLKNKRNNNNLGFQGLQTQKSRQNQSLIKVNQGKPEYPEYEINDRNSISPSHRKVKALKSNQKIDKGYQPVIQNSNILGISPGQSRQCSAFTPSSKKIKRLKSKRKIDDKSNQIEPSNIDDKKNSKTQSPSQSNVSKIPLVTAHLRKGSDVNKQNGINHEQRLRYSRRRSQASPEQIKLAVRCQKSLSSFGKSQNEPNIDSNARLQEKARRPSLISKGSEFDRNKQVKFMPTIAKLVEQSHSSRQIDSEYSQSEYRKSHINIEVQKSIQSNKQRTIDLQGRQLSQMQNLRSFEGDNNSSSQEDNALFIKKPEINPGIKMKRSTIQQQKQNEQASQEKQLFEIRNRPRLEINKEESPNTIYPFVRKSDHSIGDSLVLNKKNTATFPQDSDDSEGLVFVAQKKPDHEQQNDKLRLKNQFKSAQDKIIEQLAINPVPKLSNGAENVAKIILKSYIYPPEICRFQSQSSIVQDYQFNRYDQNPYLQLKARIPNQNAQTNNLNDGILSNNSQGQFPSTSEVPKMFNNSSISSIHSGINVPNIKVYSPHQKDPRSSKKSNQRFSFGGVKSLDPNSNIPHKADKTSMFKDDEEGREKQNITSEMENEICFPNYNGPFKPLKTRIMTSDQRNKSIVNKIFKQIKLKQSKEVSEDDGQIKLRLKCPPKQEQQPKLKHHRQSQYETPKKNIKDPNKKREHQLKAKYNEIFMSQQSQKQVYCEQSLSIQMNNDLSFVSKSQTQQIPLKIKKKDQFQPPKQKIKEEDPYGLPLLKPLKRKNIPIGSPQQDNYKKPQLRPRSSSKSNTWRSRRTDESKDKVGKVYLRNKNKHIDTHRLDGTDSESNATDGFYTENSKISKVKSTYLPLGELASSRISADNWRMPPRSRPQKKSTSEHKKQPYIQNTPRVLTTRRRSLSDIIDLSKYEKRIENGITVYRAKQPIIIQRSSSVDPFSSLPVFSNKTGSSFPNSHLKQHEFPSSPRNYTQNRDLTKKTDQLRQNSYLLYSKPPSPLVQNQYQNYQPYQRQSHQTKDTLPHTYPNRHGLPSNSSVISSYERDNLHKFSPHKYGHPLNSPQNVQASNFDKAKTVQTSSAVSPPQKSANISIYPPLNNINPPQTQQSRKNNKEISSEITQINNMTKKFCQNLLTASQELKKYSNESNKNKNPPSAQSNANNYIKNSHFDNQKQQTVSSKPQSTLLQTNLKETTTTPKQNNFSAQCSFNVEDNLTAIRNIQALEEVPSITKNANSTTRKQSISSEKQNSDPKSRNRKNKLSRAISFPSLAGKQLPRISEQKIEENDSYEQDKSVDSKYQSIILYLIDRKRQKDFPEINLIKSQKDTLIYYKNLKQLAQQLQQSKNVYDLVYIVPRSKDTTIHNIAKLYPNCYILDFNQEISQINNRCVNIPNFSMLEDVTHSLVEDCVMRRKKCSILRNKSSRCISRTKLGTSVYDPNVCSYNCCFHSKPQPQSHRCRCEIQTLNNCSNCCHI